MFAFLFKRNKTKAQPGKMPISRQELEKKVDDGTARAIKYYGRSLKKLAEFDRT